MATYVVSDLHGQYRIFLKLLEMVDFSENDQLYMLGDAIDRGPEGLNILQHVKNATNMDMLIGNHEFMMLNAVALDGTTTNDYEKLPGRDGELWIFGNGGNKTYFRYRRYKIEERVELLEWLKTRSLTKLVEVNGKKFFLTHSFFDLDKIDVPYNEIDYQTAWSTVWLTPFRRDLYVDKQEYTSLKDWTFIVGHVPVWYANKEFKELSSFITENIIDIDGGCARHDGKNKKIRGGIIYRLDDNQVYTCSFDDLQKAEKQRIL
ncbi:serine/threonine protein phosphatase 1 [Butyrivibrio sp. ob235]|uniref:metallophosphoesterase n=1 Tax=Butyrivibrio sp. ob235 TaxID=1761780 RepID=UPI0008B78B2C|nr:metallophosphoesterase [Butyrivibrio sp. ob235]SEM38314.1 serine/threonine protein phosphatase 1 [Butyrivibrio sp. ob235]